MTTKKRNESSEYYSFALRAVGDDYTPTEADFTAHQYSMKQDESLKADIREDVVRTFELWHSGKDSNGKSIQWKTIEQEFRSRIAWPHYGLTDNSTAWRKAVAGGMTPAMQHTS